MTRFVISNGDGFEAVVDADLSLLTVELATQINSFWGGAEERLRDQAGDVQRTVIRYFARRAIGAIAAEGGGDIEAHGAAIYTREVLNDEGWPGEAWKGLLLVRADVPLPDYFDLSLREIA